MKKLVCMLLAAITVATAVPTETVFATNTDNAGETTAENAEASEETEGTADKTSSMRTFD